MSTQQALETLFEWFGNESFRVKEMSDAQVSKLIELVELGPSGSGKNARNSRVGKWLSQSPSTERLGVVVLKHTEQPRTAVYQVQPMSQPKNLEFLESYEVFPHPPQTSVQANYIPSHYCLRLKLRGRQEYLDIIVESHLLEAFLLEGLAVLRQYKDEVTHGP